jgi:hypothetical protein
MSDGVCKSASRLDARMLEQRLAHKMWRAVLCLAEAEVDAGFTKVDGQQLRVTVGKVHQARLAKWLGRVDVRVRGTITDGATGRTGSDAGNSQQSQEFPPVHRYPFAVT